MTMLMMEAWVYRDHHGVLWLTSSKPIRSKKGKNRFYLKHPKKGDEEKSIRLPFVDYRYPRSMLKQSKTAGPTKVRLQEDCMHNLKSGERVKVVFSIMPVDNINEFCIGSHIPKEILMTRD